jgi:hypothetical protein
MNWCGFFLEDYPFGQFCCHFSSLSISSFIRETWDLWYYVCLILKLWDDGEQAGKRLRTVGNWDSSSHGYGLLCTLDLPNSRLLDQKALTRRLGESGTMFTLRLCIMTFCLPKCIPFCIWDNWYGEIQLYVRIVMGFLYVNEIQDWDEHPLQLLS